MDKIKEMQDFRKRHWFDIFRGVMRGSAVRRLFSNKGIAAVELALLLPLLLLLLVIVIELGRLAFVSIEVSDAAHAGALYALHASKSQDYNAYKADMMQAACRSAKDLQNEKVIYVDGVNCDPIGSVTDSDNSMHVCVCSGTTTKVSCAASCASGSRLNHYVEVKTSATVTPLIPYPGIPSSYSVSGQSTMLVNQ